MKEYMQEITKTLRDRFEMTVIQLVGSLLRRINLVNRIDKISWFSADPAPGLPFLF